MNSRLNTYLRKKRKLAGMSQADVARHLAYKSPQIVSNWERGYCQPPLKVLARLVRLHNLDPQVLIRLWLLVQKNKILTAISK